MIEIGTSNILSYLLSSKEKRIFKLHYWKLEHRIKIKKYWTSILQPNEHKYLYRILFWTFWKFPSIHYRRKKRFTPLTNLFLVFYLNKFNFSAFFFNYFISLRLSIYNNLFVYFLFNSRKEIDRPSYFETLKRETNEFYFNTYALQYYAHAH